MNNHINYYGKSKAGNRVKIVHDNGTGDDLEFQYDAFGNRIVKILKPRFSSGLSNQGFWEYSYYTLDPSGNTMGVYKRKIEQTGSVNVYKERLSIEDFNLYGNKRLGTYGLTLDEKLVAERIFIISNPYSNSLLKESTTNELIEQQVVLFNHYIGCKNYEGKNHLSNVLLVFNDAKKANDRNKDGLIDAFEAVIVNANDYYPFGSNLPRRTFTGVNYRYGFNGMEKDDEVKGEGNSYDFGARIYDSRLGRWLSLDPLMDVYPDETPYGFSHNNPISFIDPDGKSPVVPSTRQNKRKLIHESRIRQKTYEGSNKRTIKKEEKRIRQNIRRKFRELGNSGRGNLMDFKALNVENDDSGFPNKFISTISGIKQEIKGNNGGGVEPEVIHQPEQILLSKDSEDGNLKYYRLEKSDNNNYTKSFSFKVEAGGKINTLWGSFTSPDAAGINVSDQNGNVILTLNPTDYRGVTDLGSDFVIPEGVTSISINVWANIKDASSSSENNDGTGQFRIAAKYIPPPIINNNASKIKTYEFKEKEVVKDNSKTN